jgi:hypothetical protein
MSLALGRVWNKPLNYYGALIAFVNKSVFFARNVNRQSFGCASAGNRRCALDTKPSAGWEFAFTFGAMLHCDSYLLCGC